MNSQRKRKRPNLNGIKWELSAFSGQNEQNLPENFQSLWEQPIFSLSMWAAGTPLASPHSTSSSKGAGPITPHAVSAGMNHYGRRPQEAWSPGGREINTRQGSLTPEKA